MKITIELEECGALIPLAEVGLDEDGRKGLIYNLSAEEDISLVIDEAGIIRLKNLKPIIDNPIF